MNYPDDEGPSTYKADRLEIDEIVVIGPQQEACTDLIRKFRAYVAECYAGDLIFEEEMTLSVDDEIQLEELATAPGKLDDIKIQVQDPVIEIELGCEDDHRSTYISALLDDGQKDRLIQVLKEYKDYFSWNYEEMPGLSRGLVEHRIPILEGYLPRKQPLRRMSVEVCRLIREEIEKLLKASFIKVARYPEWVANVVPVMKKNERIRICIDFRA